MTPDQALAKTQSDLDQILAMERDALEGVPTRMIIGAQLVLSKTATWDVTLELIRTGPPWLKSLAGMATMNALAEATQRRLENDLLPEKNDAE